ncbi:MAG: oxygenase MpaB family protein [Polyangiales bacterium]
MPFPSRYSDLREARRRFGARVDRLGIFFDRVDPLADAVVETIEKLGGRGWAILDRALSHGISSIEDPPESFRALFAELDEVPVWVDDTTLDRGGALLMRAGIVGGITLGAKSLVHGYASPGGNKPLVFSGRLVDHASRRLNETSRFVQAVCRPGGMRRFADGFAITVKVRLMHAQVRRMILKSGRWNALAWGAPVNQHDMAGTTLLFSHSVLEGLRTFGVKMTREESESYMQLWRYVGHLIGVDSKILPTCEYDATQLAELIEATMGEPDDDSRALVKALFEHPLSMAKNDRQRAVAEKQVVFGYGACRGLIGDELADKLAVPRTSWRFAVPAMRTVITAAENVRIRSSWADHTAFVTGMKYWDRVVELGLAGANAEFKLPERLAIA